MPVSVQPKAGAISRGAGRPRIAVIARIFGGLGNQLFCYAAARRLALVSGVPLELDTTSGFVRDHRYRRQYLLDRFALSAEVAVPAECFETASGRARRALWRRAAAWLPPSARRVWPERGLDVDEELLRHRVRRRVYLEGYWQSEKYFQDISADLRRELSGRVPERAAIQALGDQMKREPSVAVHVRRYTEAAGNDVPLLPTAYYEKAAAEIARRVPGARIYCFGDDPQWLLQQRALPPGAIAAAAVVGSVSALDDLWLMSRCSHFVIANSTFSWWGAWLGERDGSMVLAPAPAYCVQHRHFIPARWRAVG